MTKTLEVRCINKYTREEKIKKDELLRLMRVLDVNSRSRRVTKGSERVKSAVPRKSASGIRLSQATLGLLRKYFSICVALRREYNGVEGV